MVLSGTQNSFGGVIKFDKTVSLAKLDQLMREMRESVGDSSRWVDLHARVAGDDGSHHLAFHYILPDGREKTQRRATQMLLGFLRKRLGVRPGTNGNTPMGVEFWSIGTVVAA